MSDYPDNSEFKSGFVTIVGAPNVGKSSLLNRMLGEKISITSKKPQTTRNRVLGGTGSVDDWCAARNP